MRRIDHVRANERITRNLIKVDCPVCLKKIRCDHTYADPYRHLLGHLVPDDDKPQTRRLSPCGR